MPGTCPVLLLSLDWIKKPLYIYFTGKCPTLCSFPGTSSLRGGLQMSTSLCRWQPRDQSSTPWQARGWLARWPRFPPLPSPSASLGLVCLGGRVHHATMLSIQVRLWPSTSCYSIQGTECQHWATPVTSEERTGSPRYLQPLVKLETSLGSRRTMFQKETNKTKQKPQTHKASEQRPVEVPLSRPRQLDLSEFQSSLAYTVRSSLVEAT